MEVGNGVEVIGGIEGNEVRAEGGAVEGEGETERGGKGRGVGVGVVRLKS